VMLIIAAVCIPAGVVLLKRQSKTAVSVDDK